MDGINLVSKFLSPLISFICGEDIISLPGIVCGILGSFAVQFGDHLRALKDRVICIFAWKTAWKERSNVCPGRFSKRCKQRVASSEIDAFLRVARQLLYSEAIELNLLHLKSYEINGIDMLKHFCLWLHFLESINTLWLIKRLKTFAGLKNLGKKHELLAINVQPSTVKNGKQNDKIYAKKARWK